MLSAWSLPRPRKWLDHVNEAQTTAELHAIQRSVNKGHSYGSESWVKKTARELGLESTMRRRGRPSKVRPNSQY